MTENPEGTLEWGVRLADGKVEPTLNQAFASRLANMRDLNGNRVRPGATVVVRRVTATPWVEVDE